MKESIKKTKLVHFEVRCLFLPYFAINIKFPYFSDFTISGNKRQFLPNQDFTTFGNNISNQPQQWSSFMTQNQWAIPNEKSNMSAKFLDEQKDRYCFEGRSIFLDSKL